MMQNRGLIFLMIPTLLLCSSYVRSQDVPELKRRIEQLETRVQLLERTLTNLLSEIERNQSKTKKDSTPSSSSPNSVEPPVSNDQSDPFRVGVTWVGEYKGSKVGKPAKWAISVSERNGDRFGGGLVIGLPNGEIVESPVSGTVPIAGDGVVIMETPLVGRSKSFARGRIQNGEIALTVKATTKLGEDVVGAATLRPKN